MLKGYRFVMRNRWNPRLPQPGRPDIEMVFDLLLAESWLAKCELVARRPELAARARAVLAREVGEARRRGDDDDARLYAAHVSLLDEIARRGLAVVQAEILRVLACRDAC